MRSLTFWDVFACVYLALTWLAFRGRSPQEIRAIARSTRRDTFLKRLLISSPDQLPQLAATVALIATVIVMPRADEIGIGQVVVVGLCVVAVVSAWLTLQAGFAVTYAAEQTDNGGLVFPGGHEPDSVDFVYFAVIVGTGCGTGDVSVTLPAMRRRVLVHTTLAFAFNALIIATAVGFVTTQLTAG